MSKLVSVALGVVLLLFQTISISASQPVKSTMKPLMNVSALLDENVKIVSKNFSRTNTNLSNLCESVRRSRFGKLGRHLTSSICDNNSGEIILRLKNNASLPPFLRGMILEVTPLYFKGRKHIPFSNRRAQYNNKISKWNCRVIAKKANSDVVSVGGQRLNIFAAAANKHQQSLPGPKRAQFIGMLRNCAGKVVAGNFDKGSKSSRNLNRSRSKSYQKTKKTQVTKQTQPRLQKPPRVGLPKPSKPSNYVSKPPKIKVPPITQVSGGSPQCIKAEKTLRSKKVLNRAGTLIKNNCSVMYRKKWLKGKGISNPKVCRPAWNALAKSKALRATKTLVTQNCPVIYAKKWRKLASVKRRPPRAVAGNLRGLMNKPVCIRAAKGQYVVVEKNQKVVNANRRKCGSWETFIIRKDSIYNTAWKTYLSCQPNGRLEGNRKRVGSWEKIKVIPQKGGTFAFRCMAHGKKYLVAEGAGGKNMNANRPKVGSWERFRIEPKRR